MTRLVILRLLETYYRHRWLYALPLAVMLLLGIASIVLVKPLYVAESALYVPQETLLASLTDLSNGSASWVTPADVTIGEYNELLKTDTFIRAIIHLTNLEPKMAQGPQVVAETIDTVRKQVWVDKLGTNMVVVAAANEDPATAQQLASAATECFLQWKINAKNQESDAAESFFADLLKSYQAQVDKARQDLVAFLDAHPAPVRGDRPDSQQVQIDGLQSAVDQAVQRLNAAQEKDENARLASVQAESQVRQSYQVIDAPQVPLRRGGSRRSLLVKGGLFALAGLLLSALSLIGGALTDSTLRFPFDVQQALDLPVLALVPDAAPVAGRQGKKSGVEMEL